MNRKASSKAILLFLAAGIILASLYPEGGAFAASAGALPCNIQLGSCTTRTPEGMVVEFDIQPKPVTAMSQLTFIVKLSKDRVPVTDAAVQVDLTMPGMFMGTTRPKLDHIGKGRYEGRSLLVQCASGRKTWQADVMIGQGAQTSIAGFQFEVR